MAWTAKSLRNGWKLTSGGADGSLGLRAFLHLRSIQPPAPVPYNRRMPERHPEEIRAYVGFDAQDEHNIQAVADQVRRHIPDIVRRFYEVLFQDPAAREVFTGGEPQIARQQAMLAQWLTELFTGPYDQHYFNIRFRIGLTHVRVDLPLRYMPLGMEIIWQELARVLRECDLPNCDGTLRSLHKLLTFDLTIMLESYQKSHSERIRNVEREAMEAKLVRAEHLAEIGQLAASLAHEIKNPLAGISGAIQVIAETMDDVHPHREIVRELLRQIDRLDATVNDLLLYARPAPPAPRAVKLDLLVQRVLVLLREEPEVRKARVELEFQDKEATLYADEKQMEQVLINLILNAAHASGDGAKIEIGARQTGNFTRLTIQDSGSGMKPDVLEKALEPFFTTKAKGTGLGLAICRRIVESHGGTIRLDSTVGQGTTVYVDLPLRPWKETLKS